MIGLTREADGALRIVWLLAERAALLDTSEIAELTALSPKFALKILRKLSLGKIVASQRGKNGGYRLSQSPDGITVRQIVELIDGPIAINRCASEAYLCSRMGEAKSGCAFHCLFAKESENLAQRLDRVTLRSILDGSICPQELS